jgi:hypothetical protein
MVTVSEDLTKQRVRLLGMFFPMCSILNEKQTSPKDFTKNSMD